MSLNNAKRKNKPTLSYSKLGRPKVYNDRNMTLEGVYGNFRLMHATASLLGCVVQIQVRDGTTYEGILKTISQQFEVVLEMPHKLDLKSSPPQGIGPVVGNLLASYPFDEDISDKLIFRLTDIVTLSVSNVDETYALKGGFTDTEISQRMNGGQLREKQLEPWEGGSSDSENTALGAEEDEGANGWDANDMFRLNAEKYGVKSSYDNSLQEYTVPLTKKDTEEYKQREAKASKIALEIEANNTYQSRISLENGDEEDRFSAVVRPDEASSNKYVLPQKRRNMPGLPKRQGMPPSAISPIHSGGSKPYPPPPGGASPQTMGPNKPYVPAHMHIPPPLGQQGQPPQPPRVASPKEMPLSAPFNGEELVEEVAKPVVCGPPGIPDCVPLLPPPPLVKPYVLQSSQTLPPRIERRRENERKLAKQKGRTDEIEEFRKFSSNFKLTEESKDLSENREEFSNSENKSESTLLANKLAEQCKMEKDAEEKTTDVSKSTLNPNAKEFVFNPNAKSFTPRSMTMGQSSVLPVQQQPQRIQAQSPVIVMPHSIGGLPQHLFTAVAPPQYLMQPFAAASFTAAQPPRFRKVPLTMQPRHDITPSMHVAAATGQPILAPAAVPTPSQLTMQYTSPQGVMSPQQAMGYPQMNFVVGPRVVSPQSVVAPTSHSVSYCDTSHLPAHLINKYCFPVSAHPGANNVQGQHPPQSQTPILHPSPSPVHQSPHSQPPTPTTIMQYTQSPQGVMSPQQAMGYPQAHPMHHHHPGAFPTGPQPMVLMAQSQQSQVAAPGQQPPTPHHGTLHLHQTHMNAPGGHMGGAHILPQMTIIPTTSIATPPFVQHQQGV